MPDRPEALEGIAQHLKKFWETRLRRAVLVHIDAEDGADVMPMVIDAIRLHSDMLA